MDGGQEVIEDDSLLREVRRQAGRVHRRALALAVAATVVALLLP